MMIHLELLLLWVLAWLVEMVLGHEQVVTNLSVNRAAILREHILVGTYVRLSKLWGVLGQWHLLPMSWRLLMLHWEALLLLFHLFLLKIASIKCFNIELRY
jgi:hypothetical protein